MNPASHCHKFRFIDCILSNANCFFIYLLFFYLSITNSLAQAPVKALQVDFFATSILGVNADGVGSLEREDRLLHLIDIGTSQKYDDVYFNGTKPENKAFNEFMDNYIRTDPYNSVSNGSPYGYPCFSSTATIESCTGYDATQRPHGNKIAGVMWFKYGLMPGAKFYSFGADISNPINTQFTLTPKERITYSGAAAVGEVHPTNQSINSKNLTNVSLIDHQWYFWDLVSPGHYMFEPINGATAQSYSDYPLCLGCTTRYVYQGHVLPRWNPYFFEYYLRNEIDVTGTSVVGNGNEIWFVEIHKPGCMNNNGSLKVSGTNGSGANYAFIKWDNGSQYYSTRTAVPLVYTINNLSAGSWNVSINFNGIDWIGATITLDNLSDNPHPIIFSQNRFVHCDNRLSTTGQYSSYQWSLNGNIISGANQHDHIGANNGNYTVFVTDSRGCTGQSNPYSLNTIPLVNIAGSVHTCRGNIYSVPANEDNISYLWSVPTGATYIQNNNEINVNWGTASLTGGAITCIVTNTCGRSASNSIQVTPFLVTANSTYSCPGLNNGSAGVSTLTGGASPYLYHWNSGTNTTSPLMTNLLPGTYIVTVTDSNKCTATASTTVTNFPSNLPAPQIAGATTATPAAQLYTITNYYPAYDNNYSWSVIPNYGSVTVSYPNNNNQSAYISWPLSGGRINLSFGVQGCLQTVIYYVKGYKQVPDHDHEIESNITSGNTITRPDIIFNGNLDNTAADMSPGLSEPVDAINSYILYPNPTTGKVSLNYNLLSTESGLIQITNALSVPL